MMMTNYKFKTGDRVLEAENGIGTVQDCATYAAVAFDNGERFAVKENFLEAVDFEIGLVDDRDDFEVDDRVAYSNPFFVGVEKATVNRVKGDCIHVAFDNKRLPNGYYSKDFFEKIAA